MEPHGAEFVSGEGVRLALAPAGVGSRVIATLIDIAVQLGGLTLLEVAAVAATGGDDVAAAQAVAITVLVLVLAGYPIVMEWTTKGRTVGKLALGLRVVREDGGPIAFRHALVRGLAGLIVEKPGLLGPLTICGGLLTMSSSRREQRIGDMLAGTVVLNERSAPQLTAALPGWVPYPLQPWVLSLDLHRLDDRLALSARQFVSRAHAMSPGAQWALGEDLRGRVLAVTSPPPPAGTPTPVLLASVLAERRRRAFAAAQPAPWPAAWPPAWSGYPPAGPPPPANWPARPNDGSPFAPPT